ncbi:MAG: BMP family ABC transporter substrate-binding protein [Chloroflexi bacterium]|nr:BMP family ABC transporter substrate-binding protein [Chloroflexota bacterium]
MTLRRLLILFILIGIIFTGCQAPPPPPAGTEKGGAPPPGSQEKQLKAAFIYEGTVGDGGWAYAHDAARKDLEQKLPFVKTIKIENVKGPGSGPVFKEYAGQRYDIIFGTSLEYMDAMLETSNEYPKVKFENCGGDKTSGNMGTYFGRMYQARYLTGIVAGKMTKTNIIGYVAAFPIPEVIRGINAFTIGAKSVNPSVNVKVAWTNSWYDPVKEKETASSLIDQNADIIAQHQDSPAAQQAAQDRGKYSIGYNTDMSRFAPKAHLVAAVWNWTPFYVRTLQQVKDRTWKPEKYWGGLNDGIIDISPFGSMVPEDVRKIVLRKKNEILKRKLEVFRGPIQDQIGTLRVPRGKVMGDDEMRSMDWFVEGVEGQITPDDEKDAGEQ